MATDRKPAKPWRLRNLWIRFLLLIADWRSPEEARYRHEQYREGRWL